MPNKTMQQGQPPPGISLLLRERASLSRRKGRFLDVTSSHSTSLQASRNQSTRANPEAAHPVASAFLQGGGGSGGRGGGVHPA